MCLNTAKLPSMQIKRHYNCPDKQDFLPQLIRLIFDS